ncbi:MAG: FesM [Anaerolineales bacterium]|nr:FesM [Anaerolineales bacterium]
MDILRIPVVSTLLQWRWGRLIFQILLLGVALLIIYDGLTGPQLAPANSATVLVWVVFRGFVVLSLLLVGNLFCFSCPFTIIRTLSRKLSLVGGRWPRFLRNKWVSIVTLLLIFWLYEWLDLWSSPQLTALLVIAYFGLSFTMEIGFKESPFCKYVCPLGAFNFVYSTISPTQINDRLRRTCDQCPGKECVNSSTTVPGCGTELYVPTINSNMDCVLCIDCARACPYENVALSSRPLLVEPAERNWRPRWDMAFLLVGITFFGVLNAFGMVPPIYELQTWLEESASIQSEGLRILIILLVGGFGLTTLTVLGCSWLGTRGSKITPLKSAGLFAPTFVPMGFGIWFAHYTFHFIMGGLTILPVMQSFLLDHGIQWLGTDPMWDVGYLMPMDWIFPLQVTVIMIGFFLSLYALGRRALQIDGTPLEGLRLMLPWAVILVLLVVISLSIFNLPMEMRGTFRVN